MGYAKFLGLLAAIVVLAGGVGYYSYAQINDLNERIAGIEGKITAIQTAVNAQNQADKTTMDKMSKDVADSKTTADNAARSATQAADAAKDAQKAADQVSLTSSRYTSSALRNK